MTEQRTLHRIRILLAALIALAAAGCSSLNQFDSWPIFASEPETDRQPGRFQALGPLVDVQWKDSTTQWGVRPLFSVRNYHDIPQDEPTQFAVPFFSPTATLSVLQRRTPAIAAPGQPSRSALQVLALWPIYWRESSGPMHRTLVLPFYYNYRNETADGGFYHHWAFFPLYFGGNTSLHGSYHAVFPFGGVLKNILGRDRIVFVVFPLYVYTESGEHRSYNVLVPFFNYSYGGRRSATYFWPIVGRSQRFDDPPQWFILWPFITFYEKPEPGENPVYSSAFFPFFGTQEKNGVKTRNIIWPLYSRAYNERTGRTDLVAPWPFFRSGSGPEYSRFTIWPFFGTLHDEQVRRQFYMWPLFRFEQRDTDGTSMRGRSIMLLYRSIDNRWYDPAEQARTYHENILWPLWYYKRDGLGNSYFCSLELRGVPAPQSFDRLYAPLWRLFESETRTYPTPPLTWHSTRALWDIFRYDRDDESSFLRVAPLFSARRANGKYKSIEVLMGLFGFVDQPERRTYRVLFFPWTVGREEKP